MSPTPDRFSDEYDPEPDYDRPTAAEAAAELEEWPCDICGGSHAGLCPDDPSEFDTRPMTEAEIRAELLLEDPPDEDAPF